MRSHTRATSLVLAALLAACADQPTPTSVRDAAPSLTRAQACAASPTTTVHTDPELRAAVASASRGDVIAISGNILLDSAVTVRTGGVTITCAEPGAGLRFGPDIGFDVLLDLWAGHITVSGLALDAEYGFAAITALNVDGRGYRDIRVTGNEVECGYELCIFAVGTPGLQVTDNHFKGDHTRYGLQIQASGRRQPDGSYVAGANGIVISRNVIENEGSYAGVYGAVRVRDGRDVTITHNQMLGDWPNGVVLTNVYDSRVEQNRIDGAVQDGIGVALILANRVAMSGVSIKANQVSNSGRAGIAVRGACGNTFTGNNVNDNAVGARFEATTGDNVWRGNHGVVQDGGAFDCDGDGDVDPNQISGVQPQALPDTVPGASLSAGAAARAALGGRDLPALQ